MLDTPDSVYLDLVYIHVQALNWERKYLRIIIDPALVAEANVPTGTCPTIPHSVYLESTIPGAICEISTMWFEDHTNGVD